MVPPICARSAGSACASRVGLGIAPKQSSLCIQAAVNRSQSKAKFAIARLEPLPRIAFERCAREALTLPSCQNENAQAN